MTSELAQFLLSDHGRVLLADASSLAESRIDTLTALTRLRKSVTSEQAVAAWEMADLRRRAVAKFGDLAAKMSLEHSRLR